MSNYILSKEQLEKIANGQLTVDEVANAENELIFWWSGSNIQNHVDQKNEQSESTTMGIRIDDRLIAKFKEHAENYGGLHLGEDIDNCFREFVEGL